MRFATRLLLAPAALLAALLSVSPAAAQYRGVEGASPPHEFSQRIDHYRVPALEWLDKSRRERLESAARPALGVVLSTDARAGVRIAAVTPNGAAADAGLRTGDRLLAIDGHTLLGSNGVLMVGNARRLLADLDTDTMVRIDYQRDGQRHTVRIKPRLNEGVVVWINDAGDRIISNGDFIILDRTELETLKGGVGNGAAPVPPGVPARIQREVMRLGPGGACQGNGCATPTLLEAFRWQGLNLASVDPKLGSYFGTNEGVLVLSAGPELGALQPGDVIRKVGAHAVSTPADAMDALRAVAPGSKLTLTLLRNRKLVSATITIPKPLQLPLSPTSVGGQ